MLVTFRVKDIETRLHSKPAQIRPPELAALMRRLHTANSTIDADPGEFLAAPLNFEINANALAIAEFASCFDHRPEMIAIVEEAQFLGRMLRIEHLQCDAPITMRVSEHIALVGDITMSSDLAAKVLTSLGRHANESGQLSLQKLGTALEDHRTYAAFVKAGITPLFESLAFIAATDCGEQHPLLEWTL